MVSEKKIFNIYMKIDPFCRLDNQTYSPIWINVIWKVEDYSINISVKKIQNIPNETKICFVNFHFSHYKSMGPLSCHSNQSSYPTGINQRTIGPVNAHLISWPSKAQNIQNLENIWSRNDLDLKYLHTFIISISCVFLAIYQISGHRLQ